MFCSEAGFAQATAMTEQHAEDLCCTCLTFNNSRRGTWAQAAPLSFVLASTSLVPSSKLKYGPSVYGPSAASAHHGCRT